MQYIIKNDNAYRFVDFDQTNVVDRVEAGVYNVLIDKYGFAGIERYVDRFTVPSRIYGDTIPTRINMIKTHYDLTNEPIGILHHGTKGSGKSMEAEVLCNVIMSSYNIPVLYVRGGMYISGEIIEEAIKCLKGNCIVYLEEFEKTYLMEGDDGNEQLEFLTLMASRSLGKVLWVLTANHINKITDEFIGRPGRLYYVIEGKYLNYKTKYEYFTDHLQNEKVIKFLSSINDQSFDNMKSLAEFANFHKESLTEIVKYIDILNLQEKTVFVMDTVVITVSEESKYKNKPLSIMVDLNGLYLTCGSEVLVTKNKEGGIFQQLFHITFFSIKEPLFKDLGIVDISITLTQCNICELGSYFTFTKTNIHRSVSADIVLVSPDNVILRKEPSGNDY